MLASHLIKCIYQCVKEHQSSEKYVGFHAPTVLFVFLNVYKQLMSRLSLLSLYFRPLLIFPAVTASCCNLFFPYHKHPIIFPPHFAPSALLFSRSLSYISPVFHLSWSPLPNNQHFIIQQGFRRDTVKSPISRITYRVWHFSHIKQQILWLYLSPCLSLSSSFVSVPCFYCQRAEAHSRPVTYEHNKNAGG